MNRSTHTPARSRRTRSRVATRLVGAGAAAMVALGLGAASASASGYDPGVWDDVAQCESSGDWHINTGNGFYGGLQFHPATWNGFGGGEYAGYAHQASKAEQIAVARRVLYTQGPGAWPVCSVQAGLTTTNGGADPDAQPGDGGTPPEEPAPPEDPPATPPGEVTRYVSANYAANVRSGPGEQYAVVGSEPRGTEVSGELHSSGWLNLGDDRWIGPAVLSEYPV